ncbi:MAG: hypothetical protein L6R39_001346 [Caloplaca ligustica]|nr:MAG: hypothetical protein L6R39_001346 [Caloplaca ligustica]
MERPTAAPPKGPSNDHLLAHRHRDDRLHHPGHNRGIRILYPEPRHIVVVLLEQPGNVNSHRHLLHRLFPPCLRQRPTPPAAAAAAAPAGTQPSPVVAPTPALEPRQAGFSSEAIAKEQQRPRFLRRLAQSELYRASAEHPRRPQVLGHGQQFQAGGLLAPVGLSFTGPELQRYRAAWCPALEAVGRNPNGRHLHLFSILGFCEHD